MLPVVSVPNFLFYQDSVRNCLCLTYLISISPNDNPKVFSVSNSIAQSLDIDIYYILSKDVVDAGT